MLEDLDRLMAKDGLEAIVIHGESTFHNPEFYFVTRTHIPRGGIYLKKIDTEPILIVSNIDVENAKRGVVKRISSYPEKGYHKIMASHGMKGLPHVFSKLLREEGVYGRVGFYGRVEAGLNLYITEKLRRMGQHIDSSRYSVLKEAMATKSSKEIEALANIGMLCGKVILETMDLLRECRLNGDKLSFNKQKVTVGFVKSAMNRFFAENRLLPDEGYILSVGVKSSDPHYAGSEDDLIKQNQPILIDVFPRGNENLYFDMTRTFVLGKAEKRFFDMYSAVVEAHDASMDMICDGVEAGDVMNSACDILEKKGYETMRSQGTSNAKTGFIHSLGHGVGWTLSDKPVISLFSKDKLESGNVVTIEPGLYDPRIGGVRYEDVAAVNGKGILKLSDLEIPFEV